MDTALEDLMLTDAAPPASALRKALAASADNARKVGAVSSPKVAPMDAYSGNITLLNTANRSAFVEQRRGRSNAGTPVFRGPTRI